MANVFDPPPSSFGKKIAASTTMMPRIPPPAFIGMPDPAAATTTTEAREVEPATAAALAAPVLDPAGVRAADLGHGPQVRPDVLRRSGGSSVGATDHGEAHAEADHHHAAGRAHPLEAAG